MLKTLEELHSQILRSIAQLEELTCAEVGPPLALAGVRYTLTRASRTRTRLLEAQIYPYLLDHAPAEACPQVTRLQDTGREQLVGSSSHISVWDMRTIEARWPEYRAASHRIQTQMRVRVGEERHVVYPLLAALNAPAALPI